MLFQTALRLYISLHISVLNSGVKNKQYMYYVGGRKLMKSEFFTSKHTRSCCRWDRFRASILIKLRLFLTPRSRANKELNIRKATWLCVRIPSAPNGQHGEIDLGASFKPRQFHCVWIKCVIIGVMTNGHSEMC